MYDGGNNMVEWVISTSLLIVIVIALRQLLKDRIQPWVRYALWLVELYDFDYALLTDDVESIVWAGGMCLDSQCRLHGFNGGGQFVVRYRGGKVTATAFMGNDFWVSSADFENKEAQEWIKERLKNALDQAE